MDEPPGQDQRRLHRLVVDVLVTDAQLARLPEVIGEALCAAPSEHDGPCRIAWSQSRRDSRDADEDDTDGWTPQEVAEADAHLRPVRVWDRADVDRSLGL